MSGKPVTCPFRSSRTLSPKTALRAVTHVTPERMEHIDPVGIQMSFLLPDAAEVKKDVMNALCHFVHFFPSYEAGQSWAARHSGAFLLSIDDARWNCPHVRLCGLFKSCIPE